MINNDEKSYVFLETIKENDIESNIYSNKFNYNNIFKERKKSLIENKNKKYLNQETHLLNFNFIIFKKLILGTL